MNAVPADESRRATETPAAQSDASASDAAASERLIAILDAHAASENDAIDLYQRLQYELVDPVLTAVIRLIVDDELRHHEVLRQMATLLRTKQLEWPAIVSRQPETQMLPSSPESIARQLDAAANDEREGAEKLRDLARTEGGRYAGLFGLLLELMAMDSGKHEQMLRYVVSQLRGVAPQGDRSA